MATERGIIERGIPLTFKGWGRRYQPIFVLALGLFLSGCAAVLPVFTAGMLFDAGVNDGTIGNAVGHVWCDDVGGLTAKIGELPEQGCDANYLHAP